jgi:hypothetical protein
MPQSGQDYTAWRFQSFDTENISPQYDCELPPEVRTELNRPKRPRILGRPKPATLNPGAKWPLYLVLLFCALVLGGALYSSWRQWDTAERARDKAISQPLAPQPTPAPTLGPARSWREYLANNPSAPRAVLVKLPPPRAMLVRLPEWKIGEQRPVMMPYNLEVLAAYKGQLQSLDMLPSSGNALGETWVVGETPWIWIWAPGATRADWIDP